MGMGRVVVVVAYVVLFVLGMPRNSGGWRGADGFFATSSDSEEEKVEQEMWSDCRMDLLAIGALDLLKPDESSVDSTSLYLKKWTSLREDLQESLDHLPFETKHSLLECLISKNHFVRLFVGNAPTKRQLAQLRDQQLRRRHLLGETVDMNVPSSATFPASDRSSLHYSQASATNSGLAPTPLDGINGSPSQANNKVTLPEDNPSDLSPTPSPGGYLEPVGTNPVPRHVVTPSEQKSNKKTIIIAVVVTASVTFILAALCFCCFYRYIGSKYLSDNGQRDERPLLSLSLSDFSGNSIQKHGSLSLKADSSDNGQVSSLDSPSDPEINEGHSTVSASAELTNASNNASVPLPPPPPPRRLPARQMVSHVPPASPPAVPNQIPTPPPLNCGPPPLKGEPLPPTGEKPPPPPLPPSKHAPHPPKGSPPALKTGPPPPKVGPIPHKLPHRRQVNSSSSVPCPPPTRSSDALGGTSAKTKLKPFFWDKVAANPDQSMVWHQIKSGSFQFNEEMIETLFGYNAADKHRNNATKDFANDPSCRRIQILDSKKSQNLAISIKAQNVKVEEVCDALMEGNELPVELLQALLRMAPTADEELKLRLFNAETALLGTAEQFLKSLLNIPFAFKRMDALLFMTTLREESTLVKESLTILEEACKELRNSRLFLKLLEAVLKTGNRMNDGTYRGGAQAFKLDTLLKLSDVRGADGKTTLLHFVVQEIIRSEGRRAARVARENRSNSNISISSLSSPGFAEESEDQYCTIGLRVVSGLSTELENVRKAAGLDADALTSCVSSLNQRLVKSREFLNTDMRKLEEESNFHDSLKAFVFHADADVAFLLMEEKRIKLLVKHTTDYFHGSAGRDEGLRLFVIVRDFLAMLQKACKEVREAPMQMIKMPRSKDNTTRQTVPETRRMLFPAVRDRHVNDSSSDEERS